MATTNRTKRKVERAHKRLLRVYREISRIQGTLADIRDNFGECDDDDCKYDIEYAIGNLSDAHLSIYYASRQFEGGGGDGCALNEKWRRTK